MMEGLVNVEEDGKYKVSAAHVRLRKMSIEVYAEK